MRHLAPISSYWLLLAILFGPGCATNSISCPGTGAEFFEYRQVGQGLTIGVLRNPALADTEDENVLLAQYLEATGRFGAVQLVSDTDAAGCDYVVQASIAYTPTSRLYRGHYLAAIITLGIPVLLGLPTHDSYAHYTGAFVVYRHSQARHSYLIYNRRQYWWDNIYWRPHFGNLAALSPLFDNFLYQWGGDYQSSMALPDPAPEAEPQPFFPDDASDHHDHDISTPTLRQKLPLVNHGRMPGRTFSKGN